MIMKKAIQITLLTQMALAAAVNVGLKPQPVHAATVVTQKQTKSTLQKKIDRAKAKQQKAQKDLLTIKKQVAALEEKSAALAAKLGEGAEQAKLKAAFQKLQQAQANVDQVNADLLALQSEQADLLAQSNDLQVQELAKRQAVTDSQAVWRGAQLTLLGSWGHEDEKKEYDAAKKRVELNENIYRMLAGQLVGYQERQTTLAKRAAADADQLERAQQELAALQKQENKDRGAIEKATQKVSALTEKQKKTIKELRRVKDNIVNLTSQKEETTDKIKAAQANLNDCLASFDALWQQDGNVQATYKLYQQKQAEYKSFLPDLTANKEALARVEKAKAAKQEEQQVAKQKLTGQEAAFNAMAGQTSQQDSVVQELLQTISQLTAAQKELAVASQAYDQASAELASLEKQVNQTKEQTTKQAPQKAANVKKKAVQKMAAIALAKERSVMYDGQGRSTGAYLPGNTHWLVSARKKIAGQVFYLVGRDLWLAASDVSLEKQHSGVARIIADEARLFTGEGAATQRVLAKDSRWEIFAEKEIAGQKYYRLGSDQQWLLALKAALE